MMNLSLCARIADAIVAKADVIVMRANHDSLVFQMRIRTGKNGDNVFCGLVNLFQIHL